MCFKQFIEQQEEDENILATLRNLPSAHSDLAKSFKIKLVAGNTLSGDDEHVGYMAKNPKEIVVASPWNYGREFTFLHEIAHLVWESLDDKTKSRWAKISPKDTEESFCMAYAQYYAKNKLEKYDNPAWSKFIKNLTAN